MKYYIIAQGISKDYNYYYKTNNSQIINKDYQYGDIKYLQTAVLKFNIKKSYYIKCRDLKLIYEQVNMKDYLYKMIMIPYEI